MAPGVAGAVGRPGRRGVKTKGGTLFEARLTKQVLLLAQIADGDEL